MVKQKEEMHGKYGLGSRGLSEKERELVKCVGVFLFYGGQLSINFIDDEVCVKSDFRIMTNTVFVRLI